MLRENDSSSLDSAILRMSTSFIIKSASSSNLFRIELILIYEIIGFLGLVTRRFFNIDIF